MRPSTRIAAAMSLSSAVLMATHSAHAQIPVTVTSDLPGSINWAQQLIDNGKSLLYQLDQLERMDRDFGAMTGNRGMSGLLRDSRYDNYVPLNALEQLADVAARGFAGLTPEARALMPPGMLDRCASLAEQPRSVCETEIARPYANAQLLRQSLTAQSGRLGQIQKLMDAISAATDPAAIAQLNARLQGEHLALTHENNRITALKAAVENDQRIAQANQHATTMEMLDRPGGLRIRSEEP
jgi:type IV secretion system protein VirB5